ncbi:MAG: enoyl-CoA hydratase/isomerase family protein [Chloroflexota bacterium]|nr:enoyl-CoA hydratase/isomerase family protein [Chloroflexota bacterium]
MEYQDIKLEKGRGIAKIIINRPPLNVLSLNTIKEMNAALRKLKEDSEVKVVVIRGSGDRAFCAGVDVKDHLGDKLPLMLEEFGQLFKSLREVGKPTIAVVNGVALGGGCEVVAGCDVAIASEKAQLGQPEIKLGVNPPPASVIFPRTVGMKKAFELILTGDTVDAQEAQRIGLVNKVVPDGELDRAADEFVGRFLDKSGYILGMTREAIYTVREIGDFDKAMDMMTYLSRGIMESEDAVEGLTSFLEKRKPVWRNN